MFADTGVADVLCAEGEVQEGPGAIFPVVSIANQPAGVEAGSVSFGCGPAALESPNWSCHDQNGDSSERTRSAIGVAAVINAARLLGGCRGVTDLAPALDSSAADPTDP